MKKAPRGMRLAALSLLFASLLNRAVRPAPGGRAAARPAARPLRRAPRLAPGCLLRARRRCRALVVAVLFPALTHLLVALFHLREVLLERRADGGLLLVVQAVVEREPGLRGLLAQLRFLLLDLLMRGVHGVQVEDRLVLLRVELLLELFMVLAHGLAVLLHGVDGGLPLLFLSGVQVELVVQLFGAHHEVAVHARAAVRAGHHAGTARGRRRRLCIGGGCADRESERGSGDREKARSSLVHGDAPDKSLKVWSGLARRPKQGGRNRCP
ncbi:exported hypothetical protein [Paraburkholderia tropica]